MVDWDRVEELRAKGLGWEDVAKDAKVGFHADASAGNPGRALRALYHRSRSRGRGQATERSPSSSSPAKKDAGSKWTLLRVFYLLVPLVGVWFTLAYLVPSPVGLVIPALPYLGLSLAGLALVLIWLLWRVSRGPRWSKVYRNTVIGGVVVGFVVAGLIGLTGTVAFGCPILPPSSSLSSISSSGWSKVPTGVWQDSGRPVFYSFGSTWCPFCSASSWAEWKALTEFGLVSGTYLDYSSASDAAGPSTPEIVLANIVLSAKSGHAPPIVFQVSEDTSGTQGQLPGTASCYQQAYVTAYANGIPYIVINGVYVHQGSLANPSDLRPWAAGANGGAAAVQSSVLNETAAASGGNPWSFVQAQAWWTMAFLVKASGQQVTTLANEFGWSAATKNNVSIDVGLIG